MNGILPGPSARQKRCRQTLDLLKRGHSEKQIAAALGISPHTVHVYVKTLHRIFNVSTRGELLACAFGKPDERERAASEHALMMRVDGGCVFACTSSGSAERSCG